MAPRNFSINPNWNQPVNSSQNIPASYLPSLSSPTSAQTNMSQAAPVLNAANTANNAYQASSSLGNLWGAGNVGPVASGSEYGASLVGGQGLTGGVGLGGIAAGGYTGYQQLKGVQNFGKGEDLSGTQKAALALPTFGLSYAAKPIQKMLGIGHSQNYYDGQNREKALNQVFQGNPQSVQLKDGRTYDFSAKKDKEVRDFKMDLNNPLASVGISYLKPLALLMSDGDPKVTDDLVRVMYNELSNGGQVDAKEMRAQALRVYEGLGVKPSMIQAKLDELKGKGLNQADYDLHLNSINSLRPGGTPLAAQAPPPGMVGPQSKPPLQAPGVGQQVPPNNANPALKPPFRPLPTAPGVA